MLAVGIESTAAIVGRVGRLAAGAAANGKEGEYQTNDPKRHVVLSDIPYGV
jgi:hypothetical protein